MKTNIILVLVAMFLSGCSYSRTTYNTQTEVINHNQQHEAFIKFVEFMNKNSTSKPSEALKAELNVLLSEAELRRECTNKKGCYLVHKNIKIMISEQFIHIENIDNSYVKVDDPRVAAKYIYG